MKTLVAFHIGRGGHFNNPNHLSFIGYHGIDHFTDDIFLQERDSKGRFDMQFYKSNGNPVGLTWKEFKSGIGTIDIDGIYDTTYVKDIEDCDERELALIEKENE